MVTTDNKNVYESGDLARQYSLEQELQPPELTILDVMKEHLNGARMLDVGVGGGRTTVHFAPLVETYVGVDYSEQMIAVCRKRFREIPNRLTFKVADVRSLSIFPDNSFDFVLFSYNGLDYIPHESRSRALREIRRVLIHGGYFVFSTHNLNNLHERLRPKVALKPRLLASRLFWACRFLFNNPELLSHWKTGYVEVYDGALGYRLRTHYINPEGAVEELLQSGFRDVRIFRLATGQPILDPEEIRVNTDDWLYYLSTA